MYTWSFMYICVYIYICRFYSVFNSFQFLFIFNAHTNTFIRLSDFGFVSICVPRYMYCEWTKTKEKKNVLIINNNNTNENNGNVLEIFGFFVFVFFFFVEATKNKKKIICNDKTSCVMNSHWVCWAGCSFLHWISLNCEILWSKMWVSFKFNLDFLGQSIC